MKDLDLELLRALADLDEGEDPMDRYTTDPELRRRYEEALALRERLEGEGVRRRDLIREALDTPAPGEQHVGELVREQAGGVASDATGGRRWLPWVAAAAAGIALLLVTRPWGGDGGSDPIGPGPVDVLDGDPDAFRLLDVDTPRERYGALAWTAVEGLDVTYDLRIWAADELGEQLEVDPLIDARDLYESRWTIPDEHELPDSILVEVRAFDGGSFLDSTGLSWLVRQED